MQNTSFPLALVCWLLSTLTLHAQYIEKHLYEPMEGDYQTYDAIYDEVGWRLNDHPSLQPFTFEQIMGDTLHYEVGDAVFDIVIMPDSSLYWKSYNPKYGTEAWEKATIIPIDNGKNMISYVEDGNVGVCWYNDFINEIATVSVFVGSDLMTFEGTVMLKHKG